jgi:hypothetical protein
MLLICDHLTREIAQIVRECRDGRQKGGGGRRGGGLQSTRVCPRLLQVLVVGSYHFCIHAPAPLLLQLRVHDRDRLQTGKTRCRPDQRHEVRHGTTRAHSSAYFEWEERAGKVARPQIIQGSFPWRPPRRSECCPVPPLACLLRRALSSQRCVLRQHNRVLP